MNFFSLILVSNAAKRAEQGAGKTGTGERELVDGGRQAGTGIRGQSIWPYNKPNHFILAVELHYYIVIDKKYLAIQLT